MAPIFSGKDPEQIIQQIEFLPNMGTIGDDTLLFLDEIQAVPEAIPALRYFYEDMPEFPVVSAGSSSFITPYANERLYFCDSAFQEDSTYA